MACYAIIARWREGVPGVEGPDVEDLVRENLDEGTDNCGQLPARLRVTACIIHGIDGVGCGTVVGEQGRTRLDSFVSTSKKRLWC